VRDKFKEMIHKYGKYGPPRPGGGMRDVRDVGGGAPLMSHQQYQQQQSYRRDGRGGGGGGGATGGAGGHRGVSDRRGLRADGGRWERGVGVGNDRGGFGRRDDRGGEYRGGGGGGRSGYGRR
jgi:hypothetical protein